jgi:hypothetical protein
LTDVFKDGNIIKLEPRALRSSSESLVEAQAAFLSRYYAEWAWRLCQNLPPQVLLSDPVVLYDALGGTFPFCLDWISSVKVKIKQMNQLEA